MKNPLEFTLLEIEAMLHTDPGPESTKIPQRALSDLVSYIHYRVNWERNYQVQTEQAEIKKADPLPRRAVEHVEAALLDAAEIVMVVDV